MSGNVEKDFLLLSGKKTVDLGKFYSTNLRSRYNYGERVFMMLKEVTDLKSSGSFRSVAGRATTARGVERPLPHNIVGQETVLAKACYHIDHAGVRITGLYGMGGVGKTLLLEQINNKFSRRGSYDFVIWVVVSNYLCAEKIQEAISKKLGLYGEGWNQKTESDKASAIYNFLKRKRFALLLDDLWSKVDLRKLGVPTKENKCNIVFTTRSQDVCGRMGVDCPIEVETFSENHGWDLFQRKVGQNTLGSHADIRRLAREVAKKCHGLPLALNVIGETMASKRTVQDWNHAIRVLNSSSATEIAGMEAEILQVLKYSYDNLNSEHVKTCFRYCALFPAAFRMSKVDLIDYWICERFINENGSRETVMGRGYDVINKLVRASLLMEEDNSEHYVKMHSLVREMGIWVASDLGRNKERCIREADDAGIHELPKGTNWRNVNRMLLMNTAIQKLSRSPYCSQLTTLLLQHNRNLVDIRGEFFKYMPKVVVLNLSFNNLKEVPKQLSDLISLRYLNFSSTEIEKLPAGLQKLKSLIHLNLERTLRLKSIAGISSVPFLRVLRLLSSKCLVDVNTVEELKRLKHLEILTINISSCSALEELLRSHKLANCVQRLSAEALRKLVLSTMDGIIDLTVRNCSMLKVEVKRSSRFDNLSSVCISSCSGLKDLTWLLFAPNLTVLELAFLNQLEEIMNQERAARIVRYEQQLQGIVPFRKLEKLDLSDLPMLKHIHWSPLPFLCLKSIRVRRCPKLRKLPLNSTSCVSGKKFVIKCNDENWIESVRWEDQATSRILLPKALAHSSA